MSKKKPRGENRFTGLFGAQPPNSQLCFCGRGRFLVLTLAGAILNPVSPALASNFPSHLGPVGCQALSWNPPLCHTHLLWVPSQSTDRDWLSDLWLPPEK